MEVPSARPPSRRISTAALRLPPDDGRKKPTEQELYIQSANDYLAKHRIWELFASLMERLAIDRPADPIAYLIEELKYPQTKMQAVVIGGKRGGKSSIAMNIAGEFKTELIVVSNFLDKEAASDSEAGATIRACRERNEQVPADLTAAILKRALDGSNCKARGWVLDGFPTTRAQGEAMLRAGVLPNKVVVIDRGAIDSEMNNTLDLFKSSFCVLGDVTLPIAWQKAREYLLIPDLCRVPQPSPNPVVLSGQLKS